MSFLTEHPQPSPTRRGSSPTAKVVSPVLAVVPWVLTVAGLLAINRWYASYQRMLEAPWGWVLGGAAVLLLGSLAWAALTAWSSVGTVVAGVATVAVGLVLGSPETAFRVLDALSFIPLDLTSSLSLTIGPGYFLLLGALLLAAGLGAAGARRWGRSRGRELPPT